MATYLLYPRRAVEINHPRSSRMRPLDYRWAHAVNSVALVETLKQEILSAKPDSKSFPNAVEADIIWSQQQQMPVMGHPPQTDGDLRLHKFLSEMTALAEHFMQSQPRRQCIDQENDRELSSISQRSCSWTSPFLVKLDFKSMQAFQASCPDVRCFIATFPFQDAIFINADILVGPATTSSIAFNASDFLQLATSLATDQNESIPRHPDKIILSLGWTTSNSTPQEQALCYTNEMVDQMLQLLKIHNPHDTFRVTFPVRYTCFRNSWLALQRLVDTEHPKHGLTIWWSAFAVPRDEIDWLLSTLEANNAYANRTFYDLKDFQEHYRT